jgi:hypothetical protein
MTAPPPVHPSYSPLFTYGQIVATPAAVALLQDTGADLESLLLRHITGDWGNVPLEDALTNNKAVDDENMMILSSYPVGGDLRGRGQEDIWIITDAYRATTTILTPEDY